MMFAFLKQRNFFNLRGENAKKGGTICAITKKIAGGVPGLVFKTTADRKNWETGRSSERPCFFGWGGDMPSSWLPVRENPARQKRLGTGAN